MAYTCLIKPNASETMSYNTAKLRKFVQEFFSSEELRTLLFDYFRPVHDNLTDGMTKNRYILLLLEFCRKHNKMQDLLAAIQRDRPFFQPDDYVQGKIAPTAAPQPPAPITRNPRQIFISHAHQDAEVAQRLAYDLKAHGYDIWIAPDSIQPGEKWAEAIGRGLEESGIFVLLLSPDAVTSRWVKMETNAAIECVHEDEMQLYPLMLEACRLPVLWRAFQQIPFRGGYSRGLYQLVAALQSANNKMPDSPNIYLKNVATVNFVRAKAGRYGSKQTDLNSFFHEKTGKEFLRIPSGHFLFGTARNLPTYLEEFWIAKTPVTNAEYSYFVSDMRFDRPRHWHGMTPPLRIADHPVVYVSWHDAKAYASWAGVELPTEQQWEKAARGWDGRIYPWGNQWKENCCNSQESGINGTTPVGKFSPVGDSPYGCTDTVGNVWELTLSKWENDSPWIVRRGGSWQLDSTDVNVMVRNNNSPLDKHDSLGFRIILTHV